MLKVVNLKDYPKNQVRYIGRGSALGNPFTHLPLAKTKAWVQCDSVESAVGCMEAWARGDGITGYAIPMGIHTAFWSALDALQGDELLACYCQDPTKCHGQVIKKLWEERYGAI